MASLLRLFSPDNGVNFTALTPPFIRVVPSHGAAGAWLCSGHCHQPDTTNLLQICDGLRHVCPYIVHSVHLFTAQLSFLQINMPFASQCQTVPSIVWARAQLVRIGSVLVRIGDLCLSQEGILTEEWIQDSIIH